MYDSFFQLIREFFLTCAWYFSSLVKGAFTKAFHRAHTFNMSEVIGRSGEFARCQKCGVRLYDLRPKTIRRAVATTTLLLLALISLSRGDAFVGSQRDTAFYLDSVYVLKAIVTQADCSPSSPCGMQIASEGGSGTVFKNLYGAVGDTLRVPYNFPYGQFKAGVTRAVLYLYGADGKAKDIWMIGLAYKEVKPPLGVRRLNLGFRTRGMTWEGRIDGRSFK